MHILICEPGGEPATPAQRAMLRDLGDEDLQFTRSIEPHPGDLAGLGEDDWLHVGLRLATTKVGVRALVGLLGACVAPLSVALLDSPDEATDAHEAWLDLEACLELCGASAGIAFLAEQSLRWGCQMEEDDDVAEVASGLAEAHGLALVVLCSGDQVTAIKPDGRHEPEPWPEPAAATEVPDLGLCAGFLSGYLSDPSDLAGALARGLRSRLTAIS